MSRKGLFAVLAIVPLLGACKDQEARDYLKTVHDWQMNTVYPGLRAYCELERHVYDDLHGPGSSNGSITPTLRYCPLGGTDPVPPPAPPTGWE